MTNENQIQEATPVETPSTEMMRITADGDPEIMLSILEKKADLAPRWAAAIHKILIANTLPDDWTEQGGKMCLSSAGAERVGRSFPINVYGIQPKREDFLDATGKGYRYIFSGYGQMGDRTIYAEGTYSTRDEFLGKKAGEFRPIEDINENDIRSAANHIFMGNVIKGLLGLRNIPKTQFDEIMKTCGKDPTAAKTVNRGSGTQGGTTADDTKRQQDLSKVLIDMANALVMIQVDEKGKHYLEQTSEISDAMEVAKASCKALTSFYSNRDKKMADGIDSIKALKGQRLEIALKNAIALWETHQKGQ
jgi:hypothetical protein